MARFTCLVVAAVLVGTVASQNLPTVYEYFANGTISSGLVPGNHTFTLNGKEIRIISGAIHYWRVHPTYWRDRLRKLRALGANTVETYIAWNLHEPYADHFDFGDGGNDLSEFLDVEKYIRMAQEEDLLVIIRPGPFINTELDFGGLPSWLQRDPNMRVRENYQPFLDRSKIYLDQLLQRLEPLQFTRGGSIMAIQIENEFASFGPVRSKEYLEFVAQVYRDNGFGESVFFTSDHDFGGSGIEGGIPGVLQTANAHQPDPMFEILTKVQPGMPYMVMEFYSGWTNHWGDERQYGRRPEEFEEILLLTFGKWNGSVNFYTFAGGTNFAFMAGANALGEHPYIYQCVTSYDFDAMLTEAGDYTVKYDIAARYIEEYENPKLSRPPRPQYTEEVAYPTQQFQEYLTYNDLISQVPDTAKFMMEKPVSMENLPMNHDSGQSYGYIIYRKSMFISPNDDTSFKGSYPRDIGFLLVDGQHTSRNASDYWINSVREFPVNVLQAGNHTVDLLVEPLSRVGYGYAVDFIQQKGIAPVHNSKIEINGEEITNIEIIAMEFKNSWMKNLTNFRKLEDSADVPAAPVLLQTKFTIADEPKDTYLDMSAWHKGIVFVNGFNIGRYWKIGPQQNLFIPAPLLKKGINTISVFEMISPHSEVVFSDEPNLGGPIE